ncbi:Uncharacterized conserved protein [Kluyvera cryocrescens]|uniref:Uncharacterized conserved protein n=1 Tax=Kluyvera cryocrescens TaxID=580 RepID=A0A485AUF7_KLUCR|nr:Uncharacterized conserved protein [Kluyvera cryocrescens]
MAFVAVYGSGEHTEILGVTRAISDPDNIDAEFAVLVRSDLEGPWPWWTFAGETYCLYSNSRLSPAEWDYHAKQSRNDSTREEARI